MASSSDSDRPGRCACRCPPYGARAPKGLPQGNGETSVAAAHSPPLQYHQSRKKVASGNASGVCRFVPAIAVSREVSIENEKKDVSDYKVFTDGSDHDGGVGAAAVLFANGWPCPLSRLKVFLGTSKEHGNYEAEVAGGLLAMQLIKGLPDVEGIIRATIRPKAAPGQRLVQKFLRAVEASTASIRLVWISGHSDVRGNEQADKLAKEAAERRASERVRK